jgi:hypothetical protein
MTMPVGMMVTMLVDRMMVTILVTLLVTLHLARYKSIRRENAPPPPVEKLRRKTDERSVSFFLVRHVILEAQK